MMKDALNLVRDKMPKINKWVGNGIAYYQMQSCEPEVDKLLAEAFRHDGDWSEECLPAGFRYLWYEHLTPEEEYVEINKRYRPSRRNRRGFNMAPTDVYMIRIWFENAGERFSRTLCIPFCSRGGIMRLAGTKFAIRPVLKTKGLSETGNGYFTGFKRQRIKFDKTSDSFLINGSTEHTYIPYSQNLHNRIVKSKTYYPALATWLYAKYGVRETFRRFLNMDIQFYAVDDPYVMGLDLDIYTVCKADPPARGIAPSLAIVCLKEELTPVAKIMIASIFYVAKAFPTRIIADHVDNAELWKIMLGYAIHGLNKTQSEVGFPADVRSHFANLERVMDADFRKELLGEGVECETIYDYFYFVIDAMTNRSNTSDIANLYGRYYTTAEYVLSDLRVAIFSAHYALIKLARGSGGRPVATNKIVSELNKILHSDKITGINNTHGELEPFMTASANMLIGLTSHCIDQTDAKKGKGSGSKTINLNDPTKHLHASFVEAGSVANLPKSMPIGPYRINPYVSIDPQGKILRKPHLKDDIAKLDGILRAKGGR